MVHSYACVNERTPFNSYPNEYENDGIPWATVTGFLMKAHPKLKKISRESVVLWINGIGALRTHRLVAIAEQDERVHVLLMDKTGGSVKHAVVTSKDARVVGRMTEFDTFFLAEKNIIK